MKYRGRKATNWFRFFLKLGLLATDAAVWASLNRLLTEREDSPQSRQIRNKAAMALRHRGWSRTTTLVSGVGIGVGLGLLLAPVSGEEARHAIRNTAEDVKNKWNDVAAWAEGFSSQSQLRTGTYAE